MSLAIGATPAFGAGAIRKDPQIICIQGTFTTTTGVFAATGEPIKGYSLGSFTSGVATLTFPKDLTFLYGTGHHNTDSATEASRFNLQVRDVSYALGTATVRLTLASDDTEDSSHAAPTGTLKLVLFTGS